MVDTPNLFSSLSIQGWRQFDSVDLKLHRTLTVITGANGSGKSTLLSLFASHFGWQKPYLSVPEIDKSGQLSYITKIFRSLWTKRELPKEDENTIGEIRYSNNLTCAIRVRDKSSVQYGLKYVSQQPVQGLHIDSFRPAPWYQAVGTIPLGGIDAEQAFNNYNSEALQRYQGSYGGPSPTFRMKEALIAMAIFGEGNSRVRRNERILKAYTGFVDVLRNLFPEELGFVDLEIRNPEVIIKTNSGEFMLDASSGGLMTLLDLAWRIHMFSIGKQEFAVTLDEPENHLHPSMQRTLLPKLIKSFPRTQFIVATHSPFMVSSVKNSAVFVLRHRDVFLDQPREENEFPRRKFLSEELDTVNKAASANEILRDVLGVPATIPDWVANGVSEIVEKYRSREISVETLNDLRGELSQFGYGDLYPGALAELTSRHDKAS